MKWSAGGGREAVSSEREDGVFEMADTSYERWERRVSQTCTTAGLNGVGIGGKGGGVAVPLAARIAPRAVHAVPKWQPGLGKRWPG